MNPIPNLPGIINLLEQYSLQSGHQKEVKRIRLFMALWMLQVILIGFIDIGSIATQLSVLNWITLFLIQYEVRKKGREQLAALSTIQRFEKSRAAEEKTRLVLTNIFLGQFMMSLSLLILGPSVHPGVAYIIQYTLADIVFYYLCSNIYMLLIKITTEKNIETTAQTTTEEH